jgi:hypothetical protein
MARASRPFLIAAAAVLVVGVVFAFVPFLTRERAVTTATPVPDPVSPLESLKLQPRARVCVNSIPFTPDASRVRMLIGQLHGPPQPLQLSVRAAGLDETNPVAPRYAASTPIVVGFTPVARASFGTVCLRNVGDRAVNAGMTSDPRNISRSQATLDGKPYGNHVPVTLFAAKRASLLSRVGAIVNHVAAFKPSPAHTVVWILVVLVIVALPALILWGVAAGLRPDDDEAVDRA